MRQKSNNTESVGFFGSISSSSFRNLLPRSSTRKLTSSNPKSQNSDLENTPPVHPNIPIDHHHQSKLNTAFSHKLPPLKVVVRIGPENSSGKEGDRKIKKVSSDTLCVGDRQFTFDEVFDTNSNQDDVFQSMGVPLVRNVLAGHNTSILSYGQSGSGKAYTMWGPLSAIVEEPSHLSRQGIVPRIFRMLFSELEKERLVSEEKQLNYQCRCSFLEICGEQIGNLLNPNQKNLYMKYDSKIPLHIENLFEEYVTSYDDVAQILIKGLSSRKVGAMDSNRSSSHIIFTFVIEPLSKGFTSSKVSRIKLIDLAGLGRDEVDDGGRQCLRESKHVEKSLSQLEHSVDALSNKSQSATDKDITPDSCLTRLLRESLVGNAKVSVICSISADNKSDDETLSILRFGEQVRSIRNEPVIDLMKEGDVDLSDKIRHLKEELFRAKDGDRSSVASKNGCFQVHDVRESLNQLRVSLNRSLLLPNTDNDTDKDQTINDDDIKKLCQQIDELDSSCEGNPKEITVNEDCVQLHSVEENCDADSTSGDETEKAEVFFVKKLSKPCHEDFQNSFSVSSCSQSPIFDGPLLSESPKFSNTQRKSGAIPSSYPASRNNLTESSTFSKDALGISSIQSESSKAESLAASLQRGLQIIDYHQRQSALNKSSTSFSFEHLSLTPCLEVDKVESYDQTIQQKPSSDEVTSTFLCASCQTKISNQDSTEVQDSFKSWFETVGKEGNPDGLRDKHLKNVMAKGITREMELEHICKEQAARIEQLNQLVEKLKGEKELNSISVYGLREEYNSIKYEDKLLRGTSLTGHLPYIMEEKCEVKEVQEELAQRNPSFDLTEKESLLKEIQNLRSKLQLSSDAPVKKSMDILRSSLILRSTQLQNSGVFSLGNEELEKERERWTEMESEWICLTDELRADLESYRQRAERLQMELRSEKKCTAEMDDDLKRAVIGHARMVEHYADLQEKYDDLAAKHDATMEGIAELKKAVAKASKKGHARFAKSLSAELSTLRVERERESKLLRKENQSLKIQLRDTADAVQAAGELFVRLREAEQAALVAEENFANVQQDNEQLRMQMEKLNRKHATEINTMKQYLSESKLPESALQPVYREYSEEVHNNATSSYTYDDEAWRAEFGSIYQEHY